MSKDFTEPIESWFWPKVIQENTDENETDLEEPKIKDITFEEQIQGAQFHTRHFWLLNLVKGSSRKQCCPPVIHPIFFIVFQHVVKWDS